MLLHYYYTIDNINTETLRSSFSIMAPIRLQSLMTKSKIIVILLVHMMHSQVKTAQDPANANSENTIFYFDSNSDCNGPIRELYGFEATIRGNDLTSTRLGPKSCIIRLQSSGQFEGTVLDIEVKAMNILDSTTKVTIYDGDGTLLILMFYDYYSNQNLNKKRFLSTGNTATFIMVRENINSFNFDIEIKINPVRGGTIPGYENQFGSGYFFDKFSQTTIVGLIAGFYGLILAICTTIFIVCCCRYQRLNKKWEIQQLATIKTGAVFDTKNRPSNAWSVEMNQIKGPASQYSVGIADPKSRKTVACSEDVDSDVLYNVDAFQKKRLVNTEKGKAMPRHTSSNASFTEAEDDSYNFDEKIITPRIKYTRGKLPPSYEDAISDHSSDYSSEDSTSESSVREKPMATDEERSSGTQSESVSEIESDHSGQGQLARTHRQKRKPHRSRRRGYTDENNVDPSKSNHSQKQLSQHNMQQVPFGAYPAGQFVPVMVGPNQFQPVTMAPPFPPPSYAEQQAGAFPRSQVQPTEPPVYSYLVRRGYRPMDTHSNSAASKTSGGYSQEPELRLDSGVEYMRR